MNNGNDRPENETAAVNCQADEATVSAHTGKVSAPDTASAAPDPLPIAARHRQMLDAAAVPMDLAHERGLFSVTDPADLPESLRFHASSLPGLVFPWVGPDGQVHYQLRPDTPGGPDGDSKYLQPAGVRLLNVLPGTEPAVRVLIVEGGKQCLTARAYARPDELVIGIPGCANAMKDGQLLPGLDDLIEGLPVVMFFDVDLRTNPQVRQSAEALRDALLAEGATSCEFARIPGTGNAGLDDYLGGRSPEKRPKLLARMVTQAKEQLPPLTRQLADAVLGRPTVDVSNDRLIVISETRRYLLDRFDGELLFDHGGVISELAAERMKPVDKDRFPNYLAEAIYFYTRDSKGNPKPAWPDTKVIAAVWTAASAFTPLEQLITVPFVRPDGSICQEPGYDAATKSWLRLDAALQDIFVPPSPTDKDVERSVSLLLDDWFGDMPLHEPADRANLLALILTPFIRRLVPLAPMAVIDGLMMGVGKGLLADCLSIVVTGSNIDPLPFPGDDDELRKMITSHFGTGSSMFVFDEAHIIKGTSLARALTAVVYTDRILGYSRMGTYANVATWMALGNQVQVQGDLARRVYRIALRPDSADPERRKVAGFRQADLRQWTRDNRASLIEAILTLVRAWFNAGQPPAPITIGFGSFEVWQRIAGGIVAHAGVPEFLGNTLAWRNESDFETAYWQDHLKDVELAYPAGTRFTIKQVVERMEDRLITEFPPGLYAYGAPGYARQLGQAYYRVKDRWFGDIRLVRDGSPGQHGATGRVSAWRIEKKEPKNPDKAPPEGSEGSEGSGITPKENGRSSFPATSAHLAVLPAGGLRSSGGSISHRERSSPDPSDPSDPSREGLRDSDDPIAVSFSSVEETRLAVLAGDLSRVGVRIDVPRLEARLSQQNQAATVHRQSLVQLLSLTGKAVASPRPWTTHVGLDRFGQLAGPDWPCRDDGRPKVDLDLVSAIHPRGPLRQVCGHIKALLELSPNVSALAQHRRGDRVHPTYEAKAVTGRWVASSPNLLGFGHRNDRLLRDRDLLLAERGQMFIGVDLAGIDARCVAGLSGDSAYAELFQRGVDIHSEISMLFFGDRLHRKEAKAVTHGMNYGRGAADIARQTGLSVAETEGMMCAYRNRYPDIVRWQQQVRDRSARGYDLPTGTGRFVAGSVHDAYTKAPARTAQGCARDLAATGLLRVIDAGLQPYMRLFLHDELVMSVPEAEADRIAAQVQALMSFDWLAPTGLVIPIAATAASSRGPRWSDLYRSEAQQAPVPVTPALSGAAF